MLSEPLKTELEMLLAPHKEAAAFLNAYGLLCHAIDDLIDRDNKQIADYSHHALYCYNLALDVYSCPFYHVNLHWLYPLAKNIHRVYSDSVAWEKSDVVWKAEYADKLRCCGNEMILAILDHVCRLPFADIRRISLLIREDSWHRHHTIEGKPI